MGTWNQAGLGFNVSCAIYWLCVLDISAVCSRPQYPDLQNEANNQKQCGKHLAWYLTMKGYLISGSHYFQSSEGLGVKKKGEKNKLCTRHCGSS